jgi:ABC-type nickel/cobalt efflux system permease component RcnA
MDTSPLALNLALVSAGLLGFRHGFDADHLAALSDIASVQRNSRQAMKMGLMYVLGHAATVALLGLGVILFQLSLPAGIDRWMEQFVGLTLLILGAYVLWSTLFQPHSATHSHAQRTRMALLVNGLLWCAWRIRRTFSATPVECRQLFAEGIGKAPAFLVGIIHGLGAETPSQLMVFLLAANLGGVAKGVFGLATFMVGMLAMNTIMCAAAAGMIKVARRRRLAYQVAACCSAAYSIIVGTIFMAGTSSFAAALAQMRR